MKRLLMILPLVFATMAAQAQLGVIPRTGDILTNGVVIIGASQQSNVVSTIQESIDVYRGRGMSIFPYVTSTNASTSQYGISFAVSFDGTSFNTANQLWVIGNLNGTTPVRNWTNFPSSVLDNVKKLQILAITNGHNASLFVSNVTWSASP